MRSLTQWWSGYGGVGWLILTWLLCSRLQVSYFEIYLDKIRDLLDGETVSMVTTAANQEGPSVDEAPDWTSTSWRLEAD